MPENKLNSTPCGSLRRGAAYIRVSTDDQLEYSPESQLEEIRAYCIQNRILLPEEYIFIEEEGRSGRKTLNRNAFQRMIAAARTSPKPFDVIVLWKFSRFARNQDESTFYKSMLRKKLDIDVVSVSEPLMEGMYGRLIEMIIEWQDEFYSVNLSAEVTRSMRYKAEHGLYNGKMPLGYHKEKDSFPVIVEPEAYIVRTIFQLFVAGRDKNYIARYLNENRYLTKTGKKFTADAVGYILENPFYMGKVRWNRRQSGSTAALKDPSEWIISDSHHTPIIDADTWAAAQKRLQNLQFSRPPHAHPVSHAMHFLSGIVQCPVCGRFLSYKAGASSCKSGAVSGGGFQCPGYRKGLHNTSQYISARKLTEAVAASLRTVLATGKTSAFCPARTAFWDPDGRRSVYEKQLRELKHRERRIREAYEKGIGTLEEYQKNRESVEKQYKDISALLQSLTTEPPPSCDQEQFLARITSVLDLLESKAPCDLKGQALRGILKKIVFYKETETLEFHYYLDR